MIVARRPPHFGDAFERRFPVTKVDLRTGDSESYEDGYSFWSDYEWDASSDFPDKAFFDKDGGQIEFKTEAGAFVYLRSFHQHGTR